jgi:hypothetical protein
MVCAMIDQVEVLCIKPPRRSSSCIGILIADFLSNHPLRFAMSQFTAPLSRLLALSLLISLAPALGCSGCKKKPPAPKLVDEPIVEAPVVPTVTEAETMFKAVLDNCELSNSNSIKNCQNGEYEIFIEYVRSQGVEIISPTTELLISDKISRKRLGTQIMRDYIPSVIHTLDPELIAEGDVRAMLAMLQAQEPTVSPYALSLAQPVLALTAIKGMEEEARTTIKKFNPDANTATMWLHLASIKGYASQARLGAFDLIKTASEHERTEMKIGALEAAIGIPAWTKEEEAQLCDWGVGFLTSESADDLKGTPAKLLLRCDRDTWHTRLLEEAEKREKEMTYGRPFADNFRFVCPKSELVDERKDELCTRQYDLFLRVANNTKYSEKERKYAISLMADRWLDDRSIADIGKLKDDPSAEVSRIAELMQGMVVRHKKGIDDAIKSKKDGTYVPPPSGPGEGG